jgi:AraC family transcriptional regulator
MEGIAQILHYIQDHHESPELSLETLAARAHYSPFHFHRLFKQEVGESPGQYLQRLRLEKAMKDLIFYPDKAIRSVALDSGFSSPSVFSRAFRKRYSMTPAAYRTAGSQVIRERAEAIDPDVQQFPVTVRRFGAVNLACEMTMLADEAAIMKTFRRLQARHGATEYFGIFIDSPFTTALDKCRYLAGVRVTAAGDHRIGAMTIASIPVLGSYEVLTDYALYVKQRWLRESGYALLYDTPGFEHFTSLDFDRPYSAHYRTICIGVRPE